MRVVRIFSGEGEERRLKRIDSAAEMEASEGGVSCLPRVVNVQKLNSVNRELKMMRKDLCSVTVDLQLTQRELGRVRGD